MRKWNDVNVTSLYRQIWWSILHPVWEIKSKGRVRCWVQKYIYQHPQPHSEILQHLTQLLIQISPTTTNTNMASHNGDSMKQAPRSEPDLRSTTRKNQSWGWQHVGCKRKGSSNGGSDPQQHRHGRGSVEDQPESSRSNDAATSNILKQNGSGEAKQIRVGQTRRQTPERQQWQSKAGKDRGQGQGRGRWQASKRQWKQSTCRGREQAAA